MNSSLELFLKEKVKEFVLNKNLSPQERSERFEVFCIVYDVFHEIEKFIFEDFQSRLKEGIKNVDNKLNIKYNEDRNEESFLIWRNDWETKVGKFYFYINNSVYWDSHEIGFALGASKEIFNNLLKNFKFCEVVESINNLLKTQTQITLSEDNKNRLDNWQKDFKDWGGLFFVYMKEPVTGWDPFIGRQNQVLRRRQFYRDFLKDPTGIINRYVDKFKIVYLQTEEKINELVEVCNGIYS